MELSLTGKTALITGGSRGIGLAMAARFVEAGANVMLTSRTGDDLAEAAAGLVAGGAPAEKVAWVAAHVGKPEQAQSCVGEVLARFGGLDILVNNAGTNPYFGPMIDIDLVRAQKTFEVNQLSVVVWTAAAVKAGLGRDGEGSGSIINVASIGGLGVEPGIGWYNVTKAAVLHLTKQFSFELAPAIRVNALAPGLVKTKLAAALWEGPGEDRIAAHIPLRRLGLPDDIATAALFLASDASSWMTGQTIVVDGGSLSQPSGGVG
jgi:NAD(P)-dependent dehydrogenase (short-subunit alcohol dehydrogenase family)